MSHRTSVLEVPASYANRTTEEDVMATPAWPIRAAAFGGGAVLGVIAGVLAGVAVGVVLAKLFGVF